MDKGIFNEMYDKYQEKCSKCSDEDCKKLIEKALNHWWNDIEKELRGE